jgi:hypothetical protein
MHRDGQRLAELPELAKTMYVERPILAAVRRECMRQRIVEQLSAGALHRPGPVGGIIHHPEAALAGAAEFKAPSSVAWLLRNPMLSVPIRSAIGAIAAILWLF